MNNENYINQVSAEQNLPQKEKLHYNKYDIITALLITPLSYGFVHFSGAAEYPLARFILSVILFLLSGFYLVRNNISLYSNRFSMALAITALVMNVGMIMTSNTAVINLISLFTVCSYLYWIFVACGNSGEKSPSELFPFELLKAIFVMPLGSMFCYFDALSKAKGIKKTGKSLFLVIAGLALASVPTLIVIGLLSYDDSFRELGRKLFDLRSFDLANFILELILTIPFALLTFGALYSGKLKRFSDILDSEKCKKAAEKMHFAPSLLVSSAIMPLIFVYIIFFISQLEYYISAFGGSLPENLSYAEYARSGFFELCTVSALNAAIIFAASIFCRKEKGFSLLLHIENIILSVLTLILISTALSKMILYIDSYGLTLKRILASSFMIFLAVVFIALIIRQFAKKLNIIMVSLITITLITLSLAFGDVNGIIAKYNTDRYLDGTLENFDPDMLKELGYSAVPHIDRIINSDTHDGIKRPLILFLTEMAEYDEDISVFSFNIPRLRAENILNKYK